MLLFLCKEWENWCQKLMTPYLCMLKLNIKSKLSTPEVIVLESKKDIYIIQGLIQKKMSTLVVLKQPKIYEHESTKSSWRLGRCCKLHPPPPQQVHGRALEGTQWAKPLKRFWLFDIQNTEKHLKITFKKYYW